MADKNNRDAAETVSETVPTRHEPPGVAELRRLAENATPGPWSLTDGDPAMNGQHWTIRRQGVPGIRISGFTYGFNGDAAYIAAANPATVLGLLDRLAHMTEARDNARAEVEGLTALVTEVKETAEHYYGQAYADGSAAVLRILGLDGLDGGADA